MADTKPQDPPRPPAKQTSATEGPKPAEPSNKPVVFTDFASI